MHLDCIACTIKRSILNAQCLHSYQIYLYMLNAFELHQIVYGLNHMHTRNVYRAHAAKHAYSILQRLNRCYINRQRLNDAQSIQLV